MVTHDNVAAFGCVDGICTVSTEDNVIGIGQSDIVTGTRVGRLGEDVTQLP